MDSLSRGSTLTPCRSPTPSIPVQPDHFYGADDIQLPPSPDSDGKTWLDPADDPMANRGIPVFKPSIDEFQDFEGYMNRVECWGSRSGIVKVIPPKEWTDSLPSIKEQLKNVKIKTPIEQHMLGRGGLFRQENMEKRKVMSVREWVELCTKDEFRAPGVQEVGITSRSANVSVKPKIQRKGRQQKSVVKAESSGPGTSEVMVKEEPSDDFQCLSDQHVSPTVATPPDSEGSPAAAPAPAQAQKGKKKKKQTIKQEPKARPKRVGQTREAREASLAERAARDEAFLEVFEPHKEWLPPSTEASDYTAEFCSKLERHYWRNCGLGKPAWYGADTLGSLFTDATTAWNVAHLRSALSRLLPTSNQGLPGVNTPYLYFGMWRATFAWHVEDMDLFSINYIHFGAPKFWYAIPQGRANGLEQTMRGYFPKDTSQCHQFLRHKSFLASPTLLANSSCRPNHLVQQAGEFVITFPRGYHAGFNLGLNCAESVNFALESWLELGRHAKACECISDSVRIDVDQLLEEREQERVEALAAAAAAPPTSSSPTKTPKKTTSSNKEIIDLEIKKENMDDIPPLVLKSAPRKRKSDTTTKVDLPKNKKIKITHSPSKLLQVPASSISILAAKPVPKISVTLKLGPRPAEQEPFPCCLCVSMSKDGLLRVHEPPLNRKDALDATGNPKEWMVHEICANVVPETWIDEFEMDGVKERKVFGVDAIVKDRWNLKCSACTKNRPKSHGAPVQCTKGKCPRAFHVSCARDGTNQGVVFSIIREVEKEVVLFDLGPPSSRSTGNAPPDDHDQMQVDPMSLNDETKNVVTVDTASAPAENPSESRVLKVIKKLEAQILCTQHNPAVAAQKKASKNTKIRNDLLALPSMARIKIRVSSGVFEVSLIRVIEETSTVEVLWDRGLKREFKWGSVVFGSTDGPVLQKPSDMAPEPERPLPLPSSALPVTTFPSVSAATSQQGVVSASAYPSSTSTPTLGADNKAAGQSTPRTSTSANANVPITQQQQRAVYPPPRVGPYDYWTYASQYGAQAQYPYPYTGYYPSPSGSSQQLQQYNRYPYAQTYGSAQMQSHYRTQQLNWQQPYQGPPPPSTQSQSGTPSQPSTSTSGLMQSSQLQEVARTTSQTSSDQSQASCANPTPATAIAGSSSSASASLQSGTAPPEGQKETQPQPQPAAPAAPLLTDSLASSAQQLALLADSTLEPSQIVEILRSNPQWRDIILAAAASQANTAPS